MTYYQATRVLLTADSVGGVWQYALDLARALKPHRTDVTVAHLGPSPTCAQRVEAAGVDVVETGLPLDWLVDGPAPIVAAAEALAARARNQEFHLVQVNTPVLAAALETDLPVVVAAHGCVSTWWRSARPNSPLDPAFAWHHEMARAGLLRATSVIAPTAAFAADVRQTYALDRDIHVVHNGRAYRSLPRVTPRVAAFTAGRLWDAAKRTDLLDGVAARLSIPFRAAGPLTGPHGEAVDPVHLVCLGTLDERAMAAELAARPVFVSAASFEPFGLAVLEAAQAGCALVLADTPGFRELWDGAACFVSGDDPDAYVAAIEALGTDPGARARAGEVAQARAARYSPEAMARDMAELHGIAILKAFAVPVQGAAA